MVAKISVNGCVTPWKNQSSHTCDARVSITRNPTAVLGWAYIPPAARTNHWHNDHNRPFLEYPCLPRKTRTYTVTPHSLRSFPNSFEQWVGGPTVHLDNRSDKGVVFGPLPRIIRFPSYRSSSPVEAL